MPTKHNLFVFTFAAVVIVFGFANIARAQEDDDERGDNVRHPKMAEIVMSAFADGREPGGALSIMGEVYKYKLMELSIGTKTEFSQTALEAKRPADMGEVNGFNLGLFAVLGLKLNFLKWLSLNIDVGAGIVYSHTPEFYWEQDNITGNVRAIVGGNHLCGGLTYGASLMFKIGKFAVGPGYLGGIVFNSPMGWEEDATFRKGTTVHHHFTVNAEVEF